MLGVASGWPWTGRCASARYQNDSQNAPYDENATAPKLLPLANSHMPASSWASAAVEEGEPEDDADGASP